MGAAPREFHLGVSHGCPLWIQNDKEIPSNAKIRPLAAA